MVLKLYGNPISTCTKRVAVVLHEKRVPFEFVVVDLMKNEQKAPAFVARQPFGKVPYIDDGGFVLFESRAIARYDDGDRWRAIIRSRACRDALAVGTRAAGPAGVRRERGHTGGRGAWKAGAGRAPPPQPAAVAATRIQAGLRVLEPEECDRSVACNVVWRRSRRPIEPQSDTGHGATG